MSRAEEKAEIDLAESQTSVAAGTKRRRESTATPARELRARGKPAATEEVDVTSPASVRGLAVKPRPSPAPNGKAKGMSRKAPAPKRGKAAAKSAKAHDDEDDDDDDDDEASEEDAMDEDEDEDAGLRKRAPGRRRASASAAKSTAASRKRAKAAAKENDGDRDVEDLAIAAAALAEEGDDASKLAASKKVKDMKPMEMVEAAMKAYKWWEEVALPGGAKWRYMEHRGLCFPAPYVPHGVKMRYEGEEIALEPAAEEIATFFASVSKDAPQLATAKSAKVFCRNFFKDFQEVLGKDHRIQKFELCDFEPIREHLAARREEKKAMTKEQKEREKAEKTAVQLAYGFALVDTHIERTGNYTVEPPGLFRGRGLHPKMGTVKKRIIPENITLNVAVDAVVPACPLPGHAWHAVAHDPTVSWLAMWRETVMAGTKYVALAASSSFKGKSDREKYEKARRLKKHIEKIRAHYERLLQSDDDYERQSGTAMWVIDRLALRVGGEKDEDEADTVGCCSLRVEHVAFPSDHEVTLDFLGKDSMRYFQTIDFDRYGPIGKLVFKNLRKFWKDKKKDEDLFDRLTPSRLNEQFSALMPGLSAKVFRTFNASVTLERELEDLDATTPPAEKVLEYNRANREVAILCNHQRSVPKAFEKTWEKLTLKENLLVKQLEELREMRTQIEKGKTVRLKSDLAAAPAAPPAPASAPAAAADVPAEGEDAAATAARKQAEEEAHLFSRQPSVDDVDKRIASWEEKLEKLRLDMRNRDENKAVALGTSKINYMDPRITVAWCKRVELPIERVFPRTLRDKFPWAMGVESTFKF